MFNAYKINLVLLLGIFSSQAVAAACYSIQPTADIPSVVTMCIGEIYLTVGSKRKTYALYMLEVVNGVTIIKPVSIFKGKTDKEKVAAVEYTMAQIRRIANEQVRAVVCSNQ